MQQVKRDSVSSRSVPLGTKRQRLDQAPQLDSDNEDLDTEFGPLYRLVLTYCTWFIIDFFSLLTLFNSFVWLVYRTNLFNTLIRILLTAHSAASLLSFHAGFLMQAIAILPKKCELISNVFSTCPVASICSDSAGSPVRFLP